MKNLYFYKKFDIQSPTEKILFEREVKTYQYFNTRDIDFVPRLISHKSGELKIEYIEGNTLAEIFQSNLLIDVEDIINQIIAIDKYLHKYQVNILRLKPADFILSKKNQKIYIFDFEYTFLNSRFKNTLYDQFLHNLKLLEKNSGVSLFISRLKNNKRNFYRINQRRFINKLIASIRYILIKFKILKKYDVTQSANYRY